MGRVKNWWSNSRTAAPIWAISFAIFYFLYQMALTNSSRNHPSVPPSDSSVSYVERSSKLYDKMAMDLQEHGPKFLRQGETSQSLSVSDLFILKNGSVTPILKAAEPPVRATVLHVSTQYSKPISEAVKHVFNPYFEKTIWYQDPNLYHSSMFHASHHISPVPASEDEIETEANAIKSVATKLCPLEIVLDRVVLTSTGVLLACWRATSGTDPITIRAKLKANLPRAPEKQLYDDAILHTSLARLLGAPEVSGQESSKYSDHLQLLHDLVSRLNSKVQGFKAVISELWFVEEYDILALALNGRVKVRKFPLRCSSA